MITIDGPYPIQVSRGTRESYTEGLFVITGAVTGEIVVTVQQVRALLRWIEVGQNESDLGQAQSDRLLNPS